MFLAESPLIGPGTCPDHGNDVAYTLTRNAGEATQALSVLGQVQHHWIIRPEIIVEEPLRSPPEAQRSVNCRQIRLATYIAL